MGMEEDALHAEGVGDEAGVLSPGGAEGAEGVFGDVVAALDGDLLDGVGHVFHGDSQEAIGDLPEALLGGLGLGCRIFVGVDLTRQGGKPPADHGLVDGEIPLRSEHRREEARDDLAHHEVAVGDGEGTATPITGGAGVGAGGFRTDPKAPVPEARDGAAPGGDGVNAHDGDPHARIGDLRFEGALEGAGVMGHIGGGAAHVEADDLMETGLFGGGDRAHDAPRRSREDTVPAAKVAPVGESPVGLHEEEPGLIGELPGHGLHVAAQDGGEVGVDDGGVSAPYELDEGTDFMGDGDLGESQRPRHACHRPFMLRVAIAVHKDDGDGAEPGLEGRLEIPTNGVEVEGNEDGAMGVDTLAHPDDPPME